MRNEKISNNVYIITHYGSGVNMHGGSMHIANYLKSPNRNLYIEIYRGFLMDLSIFIYPYMGMGICKYLKSPDRIGYYNAKVLYLSAYQDIEYG